MKRERSVAQHFPSTSSLLSPPHTISTTRAISRKKVVLLGSLCINLLGRRHLLITKVFNLIWNIWSVGPKNDNVNTERKAAADWDINGKRFSQVKKEKKINLAFLSDSSCDSSLTWF
jgi:hypothetical protein